MTLTLRKVITEFVFLPKFVQVVLNEFKLGVDTTLSGKVFHKSTTQRLKKSCLTFNSEDCFCNFREWPRFEFLVCDRNDTSTLYCPCRYLYTSIISLRHFLSAIDGRSSCFNQLVYSRSFNAGINLLDAARSPQMYDLSYTLEAILYGRTLDGVVQDWCTSFSEKLHQDTHMTFVSNPVSYLLSQQQSLHGP